MVATIGSRRGQRPVGRRHDQHYLIIIILLLLLLLLLVLVVVVVVVVVGVVVVIVIVIVIIIIIVVRVLCAGSFLFSVRAAYTVIELMPASAGTLKKATTT